MIHMFQIMSGFEQSFCLVKTVEIKSPFSLAHSMVKPLVNFFVVSEFLIFLSCSLCRMSGAGVIPGYSLKSIFKDHF